MREMTWYWSNRCPEISAFLLVGEIGAQREHLLELIRSICASAAILLSFRYWYLNKFSPVNIDLWYGGALIALWYRGEPVKLCGYEARKLVMLYRGKGHGEAHDDAK